MRDLGRPTDFSSTRPLLHGLTFGVYIDSIVSTMYY